VRHIRFVCVCVTMLAALTISSRAASPETQPADEQDLMRPTQYSLRMTPRMAHALARYYVADEIETIVHLTDDQQSRLTEALTGRLMRLTRINQDVLRGFCERSLQLLMEGNGRFTPETGREFAKGTDAVLPIAREFLDAIAQDARPVLTSDQFKALETKLRRDGRELGQFEGKMRRWAAGGAKNREELDDLEPTDGEPPPPEERDVMRNSRWQAERQAYRDVEQVGPGEWARFLAKAKPFLKLDKEQSAKGDQLLARYRRQAEAIMTPEWTSRVLANRTRRRLYDSLAQRLPTAPLVYRLNREYEEATAPILDLTREFREEVFALATDAQLAAALATISEAAAQHGLTVDEADARLLHLARE
jgi:hypothetical protein